MNGDGGTAEVVVSRPVVEEGLRVDVVGEAARGDCCGEPLVCGRGCHFRGFDHERSETPRGGYSGRSGGTVSFQNSRCSMAIGGYEGCGEIEITVEWVAR